MPINAEKYLKTRARFELMTSKTPPSTALHYPPHLLTALPRQPNKDCSSSTNNGRGHCSTRRILKSNRKAMIET